MAAAETRSSPQSTIGTRPYWLPPIGTGNGLAALAWASIADLTEHQAAAMLATCKQAQIAAFTAPRDGGRPHRDPVVYRVWVDSQRFGAAEDALRHALAEAHEHGRGRS